MSSLRTIDKSLQTFFHMGPKTMRKLIGPDIMDEPCYGRVSLLDHRWKRDAGECCGYISQTNNFDGTIWILHSRALCRSNSGISLYGLSRSDSGISQNRLYGSNSRMSNASADAKQDGHV